MDCYGYRGKVEDYFAEVLTRNFPGYELRRNVAVEAIFAPTSGAQAVSSTPVSSDTWLCDCGTPKLAILVCSKRDYDKAKTFDAMDRLEQACKKQGIPFHRYFREFRNDEAYYIRNRINTVLR